MKKILVFFKSYFHKIKLNTFIVILSMSFSLFFLIFTMGYIRYYTYTLDAFEDSNLNNSIYFMFDWNEYDETMNYEEAFDQVHNMLLSENSIKSTLQTVSANPFVWNETEYITVIFYSEQLQEAFPLRLRNNKNFSKSGIENGTIQCIVGSPYIATGYRDKEIYVSGIDKSETLKLKVISELNQPYLIPLFTVSSTLMDSSYLFGKGNFLVVKDTKEIREYFSKHSKITYSYNFFILFKDGTMESDIDLIKEKYSKYGRFSSYDEMLENSKKITTSQIKEALPMPLFCLLIASGLLISVSVLSIEAKMKDLKVFYLCGCSRAKLYQIIVNSLLFTIIPAVSANILYIIIWQVVSRYRHVTNQHIIIDSFAILMMLIYLCIITVSVLAVIAIVSRKEKLLKRSSSKRWIQ
jgi:hypothetical protein